jgi:hypothetical protein
MTKASGPLKAAYMLSAAIRVNKYWGNVQRIAQSYVIPNTIKKNFRPLPKTHHRSATTAREPLAIHIKKGCPVSLAA